MTKSSTQRNSANLSFVPGTSRGPRSAATLLRQMAAEAQRQEEVAQRIRELRGKVPQPVIADRVGVTLRAYQEWEAGGGIAWANYKRLAKALGVTEEFLVYGVGGKIGPSTQLDRVEAKVDAIMAHLQISLSDAQEAAGQALEAELEQAVLEVRQQKRDTAANGRRSTAKRRAS